MRGFSTLPPLQTASRLDRLRGSLGDFDVRGLLVTSLVNIRYLTGFTGSAALLLVPEDGEVPPLLATDGRYGVQARLELDAAGVIAEITIGSPASQLSALAEAGAPIGRIGFESDHLTVAMHARLTGEELFGPDALVPLRGTVEKWRIVKDEGEVARIAAAADIADAALAEVLEALPGWIASGGVSEGGVAAELDHAMRLRGSSEPAFETIVACGPRGAMPHHRAGADPIEVHQPIVIDFGATVEGYRSDMTRTVCIGEPSEEVRRMLQVVTESQSRGVAAVTASSTAAQVDGASRSVIAEAGWAEAFSHGTGHGVGLDIHEAPWVSASCEDLLPAGAVVTVEPGVYLPGVGGVRIEDTVVVTDEGCRVLTRSPKDPVIA